MDMNKTIAMKSASFQKTDAPRVFGEMAEKGATQTKETYEKVSAATNEAADLIKASCSSVLQGVQDYSNKFLEFTHVNTNAAFDFAQKVYRVKTPSEFMELSTAHTREQTQALTEQNKQLAELAQKIALIGAKPLQKGAAKAFNHAA